MLHVRARNNADGGKCPKIIRIARTCHRPALSKASRRCCPAWLPLVSRCSCPPLLSARGSPNSEIDSRTVGNRGCWAARQALGSSCRNFDRILAPRARGSPWCSSRWTGTWERRSPGTFDSVSSTLGCSEGPAGPIVQASSSPAPLFCFLFFFFSMEKRNRLLSCLILSGQLYYLKLEGLKFRLWNWNFGNNWKVFGSD